MAYEEKFKSRELTHDARRGASGKITWTKVPWDEWDQIPRAQFWACHDENSKMRCMRVSRKPIGAKNNVGRYNYCEVTAYYEIPQAGDNPPDDPDQEFQSSLSADLSVEAVTVDGTLKWKDTNGTPITGVSPSITVPTMTFNLQVLKRTVPLPKIIRILGKINSGNFNIKGAVMPAGTVLFTGVSVQQQYDAEGLEEFNCTYTVIYNPYGWNYLPKSDATTSPVPWDVVFPALYESTSLDWLEGM